MEPVTGGLTESGWRARLDLELRCVEGVSRITRRRHEGPLLVQRAFYPERDASLSSLGAPCHVYLVHPPGGIAGGDDLRLGVQVGNEAHALLTTPAAGKFYRRGTAGASRLMQSLTVDHAALEWLPQENIFYPNAAAQVCTRVALAPQARFIGWEIACFGLPAGGATLESGQVRQDFELWRGDHPVLLERLSIDASSVAAACGLAGHAAMGTWVGLPAGAADLVTARAILAATCGDSTAACTLVDGVLVCRGSSRRADRLKQVFIELWTGLRPGIVGREAVPPRVWAT